MGFTRQSTSHWLLYICFILLQEWGLEGTSYGLYVHRHKRMIVGLTRQSKSQVTVYMFSITTGMGLRGYQLWLVCSQTQEDDSGLYETINQSLVTVYMFFITTGMGLRGVPAMACMFTDTRG